MSLTAPRVIKLGGSLLDWPEWPNRFRDWLARQPPLPSVLITGGGSLADEIRRLDQIHRFDPSTAHWLAIGTMSLISRLADSLLPEAEWTDDWLKLNELLVRRQLVIFDPANFLTTIEPTAGGESLPHSWDVTSDSIAARVTELLGAQELMLLKSSLPSQEMTLADAALAEYVDTRFAQFAAHLPAVRAVNLRDITFAERTWHAPRKQGG